MAWYAAAEPAPEPDSLRAHLRRFLPSYMVPTRWVAVPEFSLHPSGKIDKDALPDPWAARVSAPPHDPPEDEIEAEIQAIWQRVLGIEIPGVDVEFFDAGGSSLLLAKIHSQIDQRHPGKIKLMELFSAASVREQARLIRQMANGSKRPSDNGLEHLVSLGGSGSRTLFCFAAGSGSCHGYYELTRRLSNWKVYGVNFIETQQPASAMADILVEAQPERDFVLLGYSIGGNMAYETALELESRGRHVRGLVFIDNWRRLERFHFTDEDYRKNAQEFLAAMDAHFLALHNREAVMRRVEAYDRYMDSRVEDRRVACSIRLVQAESHDLRCPFRITQEGWGDLTADFRMTAGSGRHLQMLEEPHVVGNAVIVDSILEELAPADMRMAGRARTAKSYFVPGGNGPGPLTNSSTSAAVNRG